MSGFQSNKVVFQKIDYDFIIDILIASYNKTLRITAALLLILLHTLYIRCCSE